MGKKSTRKKVHEVHEAPSIDHNDKEKVDGGGGMVKDKDLPTTECPGTFRWNADKVFPKIPTFPSKPCSAISSFKGWADYLLWRGNNNPKFMLSVKNDPSLIDCLSFPVTLLSMMSMLSLQPSKEFHFVSMGASRRAEEFTFRNTSVWLDIAHYFPETKVRIYFVGLEASTTESIPCEPSNLTCNTVKGSLDDLKKIHPEVFVDLTSTLFTVFNGGFGNFAESNHYELLWSWLPDLQWLIESQLPLFFTCANDYGDVRGEVAVMKALGAKFIIPPQENKFSFATTLVGEEGSSDKHYSRGNSFFYAVSGVDRESSSNLEQHADRSMLQRLVLSAMLKNCALVTGRCPSWGIHARTEHNVHQIPPPEERQEGPNKDSLENSDDGVYSLSESPEGQLVLMVRTEGLMSMASACLEVFPLSVSLGWTKNITPCQLQVSLPRSVVPSKTTASFSKRKQLVTIIMD